MGKNFAAAIIAFAFYAATDASEIAPLVHSPESDYEGRQLAEEYPKSNCCLIWSHYNYSGTSKKELCYDRYQNKVSGYSYP